MLVGFGAATYLDGTDRWFTEPRVAVGPNGTRWAVSNDSAFRAVVFSSRDGTAWTATESVPSGQLIPSPDTDIVVTRTRRVIAAELEGLPDTHIVVSYSDDRGQSWRTSSGMVPADTDRPWLAVGPDDPATHRPRVYVLFHNLLSGLATHNMFVQTSADNGASFGPLVPVTLPGSQAWLDLQCADSGGPSAIVVSPVDGRVYVSFGTRSAPAGGGCGASITGGAAVNVVPPSRHWVLWSPDASPGSWRASLAVDDSARQLVVGAQGAGLAVDRAGNVYVAYPEGTRPNTLSGSAVRYVWARPGLARWSSPVTVAAPSAGGHLLVNVAAGRPGRIMVSYMAGDGSGDRTLWYSTAAEVTGALSASARVSEVRLSERVAFVGGADDNEGRCASGPLGGIEGGLFCGRIPDVYGITVGRDGRASIAWPAASNAFAGGGSYVSTQTSGPPL